MGESAFVRLSWDEVAIKYIEYEIRRSTSLDGTYQYEKKQSDRIYEDTDVIVDNFNYYKVNCIHNAYGLTEQSFAFVDLTEEVPEEGAWVALGAGSSGVSADDVELVNASGTLYAVFPDYGDANNRVKTMSHD